MNNVFAENQPDQFCPAPDAQFLIETAQVCVDRMGGDSQSAGNPRFLHVLECTAHDIEIPPGTRQVAADGLPFGVGKERFIRRGS